MSTAVTAREEGFAFFVTTFDLGLGEFSDERLMDELRGLSQDATVFIMSRTAQVLHFCGELNPVRQFDVAGNLFNEKGVRAVRDAFASGKASCFATYEGATRLALLSILHSPRGSPVPTGLMAGGMGALLPAVHRRMFTHPTLEDEAKVHSQDFKREARLQLFLAGSSPSSASPLSTLGQELKLGALVAATAQVKPAIDQELHASLGVTLRELNAVAHMVAASFAPIPNERDQIPFDYKDVRVLNATTGVPKLIQDLIVGLAVKRPENVDNALAVLRSPRTAWPAEVSWRPFYVANDGKKDAGLCWDIRALHNMLSWGFAEFVRPFVSVSTFGAVDEAWNAALERVIQSAVASTMPTFQRPKALGDVEGVPGKVADWIGMSANDGFVVEFKNGVARPATFRNPSPEYFESWVRQRYIQPDGLRQAYITVLRARVAGEKTFARRVGDAKRLWPIVVTPTSLLQSPLLAEFIEEEAQALRDSLPPLPENVQPPTLMDIGEFLAFASLPVGTHGKVLRAFRRSTRSGARMWTFERFLYERFGRVPENAWFNKAGDQAHEQMMAVLEQVFARLGTGVDDAAAEEPEVAESAPALR